MRVSRGSCRQGICVFLLEQSFARLWGNMRTVAVRTILFALLVVTAALPSACTSDNKGKRLDYALIHRLSPEKKDVPYWVDRFWELKGRLPENYPELASYVSKRTNGKVQLENYPRVDFKLLGSGQRQADFYSVTNGVTNLSSSVTWGKPRGLE